MSIQDSAPPINPNIGGADQFFRRYMDGTSQGQGQGLAGLGGLAGGIGTLMDYFRPQAVDNRHLQDQMQSGLNEYLRQGVAPASAVSGGYNPTLDAAHPAQTQLSQNPLIQDYVRQNEDQNLHTQGAEDLQNYATQHGIPSELAPEQYRGQIEQGLESSRNQNAVSLERIRNQFGLNLEGQRANSEAEQRVLGEGAAQNLEGQRESAETQRQTALIAAQSAKDLHDRLGPYFTGPTALLNANKPGFQEALSAWARGDDKDASMFLQPQSNTPPITGAADVNAMDGAAVPKSMSRLEYGISNFLKDNPNAQALENAGVDTGGNGLYDLIHGLQSAYNYAQTPVGADGTPLVGIPNTVPLAGQGKNASSVGTQPNVQGIDQVQNPQDILAGAMQKLSRVPNGSTLTMQERGAVMAARAQQK